MKPLVLIVDDSELILQMLDMVCQQAGYRTATATSFGQVEALVSDETPSVIVTDLNLPDLDGQDAVGALHSIDRLTGIPTLVVSGMDADQLDQKADEIGADAAISKDGGMPAVQGQLPGLLEKLAG